MLCIPLLHALLAGVCGAFLAGDVFNLYVWFEVMLIASLALLVLGGRPAQLDGAVRYAALSLIATTLLLSGIGLLYGLTGTLNMADLHLRVQEVEDQGLLTLVAMVFIIAFGLKSAVFPLFFWLPASYHTPQTAVSAVFSGLLTKVGVYALIRFFTLIFRHDVGYTHELLLWVAGLTMVTGVLGAASRNELRRILSFHIISQIGYMILGLALFTTLGLLGGDLLRHPPHHREGEPLLRVRRRRSPGRLDRPRQARRALPRPAAARGAVLRAGVLAGRLSAAVRLLGEAAADTGHDRERRARHGGRRIDGGPADRVLHDQDLAERLLEGPPRTTPGRHPRSRRGGRWLLLAPIATLAGVTLAIGLYARPLYVLAERAADELMAPSHYVEAVLGGGGAAVDRARRRRRRGMRLLPTQPAAWPAAGARCSGPSTWGPSCRGFVLAFAALSLSSPMFGQTAYFRRVLLSARLGAYFLYELTVSSLQVAWDVVTPAQGSSPGIVAVPLDLEDPMQITVLANLISLTPGSLSLDVSPDGTTLYVHEMFVDDPEETRKRIKEGFERLVREAMQ